MEISNRDFRDIQNLVRSLCGLALSDDKMYLVQTRLDSVVRSHGLKTFSEYLGRLQQIHAVQMRDELVEALTTGETSFNRDIHPFDEFRRRILPSLAETIRHRRAMNHPNPIARIWSAGCSTGQEPYSISMAVLDFLSETSAQDVGREHFAIFATDVSAKSLNIAKEGRYLARDLDRGVANNEWHRYFREEDGTWTVLDSIRRQIDFRRLNLIDPVPNLGPFDVIFCRNVLIYFDQPTRQRLCDQFEKLVPAQGLLILGAAENLYGLKTTFESEQIGETFAYRKSREL